MQLFHVFFYEEEQEEENKQRSRYLAPVCLLVTARAGGCNAREEEREVQQIESERVNHGEFHSKPLLLSTCSMQVIVE